MEDVLPVPARADEPPARRRFAEILEDLIATCSVHAAEPDAPELTLEASALALGAAGASLTSPAGELAAVWGRPTGGLAQVTAPLADGGALTMTWDGKAPVTKRQLALVAQLVSMVGRISTARRQADERFENQRQAWGQEIHDGVTQSVTAAILALQRVQDVVADAPVAELIDATVDHVRQSLVDLREVLACVVDDDGHLVGMGHDESLQEVVDDVRTRWRLQARVSVRGDLVGLDRDVTSVATAVVREALINVAKHAGASRVSVTATRAAAGLRVTIADDGAGLAAAPGDLPRPGLRMGLRLLEQRVALAGGSLDIGPRAGGGTEVRAVIPLDT